MVADDLAHLLDALDLAHVPVVGRSAGSPHALAMASCHGDRVASVAIVSGACHLTAGERARVVAANANAAIAAEHGWEALHTYLAALRRDLLGNGTPEAVPDAFVQDLAVLDTPLRRDHDQRNRSEALRQGAEGWTDETLAIVGDWDIDLDAIHRRVRWWHGVEDNIVPLSAARRLAARLPDCDLVEVSGVGHQLEPISSIVEHLCIG